MKKFKQLILLSTIPVAGISTMPIIANQATTSIYNVSTNLKNNLVSTSGNYIDLDYLKSSGKNLIFDFSNFINQDHNEFTKLGSDANILGNILYINGKSLNTVVSETRNSSDSPAVFVTLSFSKSNLYPLVNNDNFKNYLYISDYSENSLVAFWKISVIITTRTSKGSNLTFNKKRKFINKIYDIDLDASIINEIYKLADSDNDLKTTLSQVENSETMTAKNKVVLNNAYYDALGIVFPWIKDNNYNVDLSSIYYYWEQIKNMNDDYSSFKETYRKLAIEQNNLKQNDSIWNNLKYTANYSVYQNDEEYDKDITTDKNTNTIVTNLPISIGKNIADNWGYASGESSWGNMRSWNFFYARNDNVAKDHSLSSIANQKNTGYIYAASTLSTSLSDFNYAALTVSTDSYFKNLQDLKVESIGDNSLKVTYWVSQVLGTTTNLKNYENSPYVRLDNDQYVILSMTPIIKVYTFPSVNDEFNTIIDTWKKSNENLATLKNAIPYSLLTSDNFSNYITTISPTLSDDSHKKFSWYYPSISSLEENKTSINLYYDLYDNRNESAFKYSTLNSSNSNYVTVDGFITTKQYLENISSQTSGYGIQVKNDIKTSVVNYQDININNITDFIEIKLPSYVGNEISYSIDKVDINKTDKTVTVSVNFNYSDSNGAKDTLTISRTLTLSELKLEDIEGNLTNVFNKSTISLNQNIPIGLITNDNWEKYITINLNADSSRYSYKILDNSFSITSDNKVSLNIDIIDKKYPNYSLSSYGVSTTKTVDGFVSISDYLKNISNQDIGYGIQLKDEIKTDVINFQDINMDNISDFVEIKLPSYVGDEITSSISNVKVNKQDKTVTVSAKFDYKDSNGNTGTLTANITLTLSDLKLNDNEANLKNILENLTVTLNSQIPTRLITADNWEKYITVNLNADSSRYSYKLLDDGITIDNDNQVSLKIDIIDNKDPKYPLSSYGNLTSKVVTGFIAEDDYTTLVKNDLSKLVTVKKEIDPSDKTIYSINTDNWTNYFDVDVSDKNNYKLNSISYLGNNEIQLNITWSDINSKNYDVSYSFTLSDFPEGSFVDYDTYLSNFNTSNETSVNSKFDELISNNGYSKSFKNNISNSDFKNDLKNQLQSVVNNDDLLSFNIVDIKLASDNATVLIQYETTNNYWKDSTVNTLTTSIKTNSNSGNAQNNNSISSKTTAIVSSTSVIGFIVLPSISVFGLIKLRKRMINKTKK